MLPREKPLIIFFAGLISLIVGLELSGRTWSVFSLPENMLISHVLFMLSAVLFSIFLIGIVMWRPMERRERARFFLLLLSSAEESGQSAEQAIISFSRNGKQSLEPELDWVAWHIRSGMNLSEALAKVPGCLPAQVVAFEREMPKRYAWADLVICRAGALTIAELTIAGMPALWQATLHPDPLRFVEGSSCGL